MTMTTDLNTCIPNSTNIANQSVDNQQINTLGWGDMRNMRNMKNNRVWSNAICQVK